MNKRIALPTLYYITSLLLLFVWCWILKLVRDLAIVHAHAVFSNQFLELIVHFARIYETTQMVLCLFVHHVNSKHFVESLWCSHSSDTVKFLLRLGKWILLEFELDIIAQTTRYRNRKHSLTSVWSHVEGSFSGFMCTIPSSRVIAAFPVL